MTYTLIDSTTLASSASSVTFSSITQDYRDLVLVLTSQPTAAASTVRLRLNGDTGSNYTQVRMEGNGFSATSEGTIGYSLDFFASTGARTSSGISLWKYQIMDYSATDKHKPMLLRYDAVNYGYTGAAAGRWANTSAVTSLNITYSGGTIEAGTTFYLYGIASEVI